MGYDPKVYSDGNYRWTLTQKGKDETRLCWLMLNPSTADEKKSDHTVSRCLNFAAQWGFDGFTIVNLYPYRSQDYGQCRDWVSGKFEPDDKVSAALAKNLDIVADAVTQADTVVAAWGNHAWDWGWAKTTIRRCDDRAGKEVSFSCLRTNLTGMPSHPGLYRGNLIPVGNAPGLWDRTFLFRKQTSHDVGRISEAPSAFY
jgi:hypothetical protein